MKDRTPVITANVIRALRSLPGANKDKAARAINEIETELFAAPGVEITEDPNVSQLKTALRDFVAAWLRGVRAELSRAGQKGADNLLRKLQREIA